MALIIAGDRSGVGKTTCTLCLLAFLKNSGITVQSFKVGPDYIDPMFHQYITGRPCRNLDPILTSENYIKCCFYRHTRNVEFAIIEGVMGLFDGVVEERELRENLTAIGLRNLDLQPSQISKREADFASTAHIARLLDLPVLLIIDCSRLSGSVAAIAHGYRHFDPRIKLAGIVLNRVGSDRHRDLLKSALEPLNLPILGLLRREDKIAIPDRHLGLVPTLEIPQFDSLIDRLYHLAKDCFNWEILIPLLKSTQPVHYPQVPDPKPQTPDPIKIAIARDAAFNFYYQDNLDIWQRMGAELIPWSPLTDSDLPEDVQGLYFGGGFPEIFARQLAENRPVLTAVRTAILKGMPTYAECGGLMYLCEFLIDFDSKSFPMVGILPTQALMSNKLTLGYRQAVALQDSFLIKTGERVRGHEFHRSQLTVSPSKPLFETTRYNDSQNHKVMEGWQIHQLHASYIHLHWGESWKIPQRFLRSGDRFRTLSMVE